MPVFVKFFLMVVMLFPFTVYSDFNSNDTITQTKIKEAVSMASETYGIKSSLILSVIQVESKFNPTARNGSNVGLMQVHTKYHKHKFADSSYYNIYTNVFVGTSILKECLTKHKNKTRNALKCYNGGGDKDYIAKVLKILRSNPITI